MKVLFVCSGNSKDFAIAPFIKAQGESLKELGVDVSYFPILGKGFKGYFNAGLDLRNHLKVNSYDLIHAHFSLSGWSAVLGTNGTPVVLSLMGTDAQGDYVGIKKVRFSSRIFTLSSLLIQPFVKVIISKAANLEKYVYLKHKSYIIPNGVDTEIFRPSGTDYRQELDLKPEKKYVLFLGSQKRIGKNYPLAKQAVERLNLKGVELINPYPVTHDQIPKYLNAASVLVMPSFMEGSPNVIKEAMACNCPIVTTNVGDVSWVIGETEGCYLASHSVDDFSDKIRSALAFSEKKGRTNGESRIKHLGLDSASIAQELIKVYHQVIPSAQLKKQYPVPQLTEP